MPRQSTGPKLVLFGPDEKFGARAKPSYKGYVWQIVWYERGIPRSKSTGVERGRTSEEQRQAVIAANQRLAEHLDQMQFQSQLSEGSNVRRLQDVTVAECLTYYATELETINKNPETPKDLPRIGYAIVELLKFFGNKTLADVGAKSTKDYAKQRVTRQNKPAAAGSIKRELGTLKAAINLYKEDEFITEDRTITMPKNPTGKKEYLRRHEAVAILRALHKRGKSHRYLMNFFLFGLYFGARKGAALDVQFYENALAGSVDLENNKIDFNGNRPVTKKRRAKTAIPRRMRHFLRCWKYSGQQFVIEGPDGKLDDIKKGFHTACLDAAAEMGRLAILAEQAGDKAQREAGKLTAAEYRESKNRLETEITPHSLRHTCITWLLQRGVAVWIVGNHVGDSAETITRYYGHHCPGETVDHLDVFAPVRNKYRNKDFSSDLREAA